MKLNKLPVLLGIVICFLTVSCSDKKEAAQQPETGKRLISAHTAGVISRESRIHVRFTDDMVDDSRLGALLEKSPMTFSPDIPGECLWTTTRTLEFRPEKNLPTGQAYTATVILPEIMETAGPSEAFGFGFSVMKQHFEITIDGPTAVSDRDLKRQKINGKITTADVAENANVEKTLSASQSGNDLKIHWIHENDRKHHLFEIHGIVRNDMETRVKVNWNGAAIGVEKEGSRDIGVPALKSFSAQWAKPFQEKTQYIEVRFSDPLEKDQDLDGLIRIKGQKELKFTIDGNTVRVYSAAKWSGESDVSVQPGIRNALGRRLETAKTLKVFFEDIKPRVRFASKGVIVPTTRELTIPIEAVNLRGVVVEALRIHEKNIPQFLQVNTLDGDTELKRVGRVVWKKTVRLDWTPDKKNRWVRYGLDITPLIKKYTDGMFRIRLTFRQHHAVYHCGDVQAAPETDELPLENLDEASESSYWDSYGEEDGYDDYYERENPCHRAYYKKYGSHDIAVSRNILISDIGLIAKKGGEGSLLAVATDIRTATPLPGATLTLLDYQHQEIASGRTGENGMATLPCDRKPYLLVANHADQSGFLKLDDGSALSVSHFDVSGQTVKKGLKGFIYGERGVWRPGDRIFLTLILLDRTHRLPKDHPVQFELRNPKGQLVKTLTRKSSTNGFYSFQTATRPDAPTGNWTARFKAGGARFEKVLKIETVMPNRLKLGLDFGEGTRSLTEGPVTGQLSARWLHGAIAKNLKSDVKVTLTPAATRFQKYPDFAFDDPVRTYTPESQTLFEGNLDDKGTATFKADIQAENVSPGMLTADFTTRVFEPGGAFSIDSFRMPYHPYERYIGLRVPKGDKARGMLLTDTDHTVDIVAVDPEGNPVESGRVEVKMYKIKWRWWWEKDKESFADFTGSTAHQPLETETIDIRNGIGRWRFNIKYPEWGRYLIRVRDLEGNHTTGRILYVDWPGWAGRAQKDTPGGAGVLTFSADKTRYNVGETVTLVIPTGKKGRGLVSIESGSRILETAWIEAGEAPTRYSFVASDAMTPNVYAHVTFLQPHMQAGNDLPIRMYGVVPIEVTDPGTHLHPRIAAPDHFVPETTARITVREAAGSPMTYTVAVVDEGLLGLTRFATPDPWHHFYQRETLGVKTWDLFDWVAGAYGGSLEQLLAIGGGGTESRQERKKANRFPPMVRFLGPFELAGNRENTHDIEIPRYVGSVRIMVVAGRDNAFGTAEKSVFVRKPLMVLGTLPRVLGSDETVALPVSVFALDEKVKQVSVTVMANQRLSVIGESTKRIAFSDPGDEMVSFRLKAGTRTGVATVAIRAQGGGESAGHDIELDIRMPGGPVVDIVDGDLDGQATWHREVSFPGMAGTNTALLEVSRIPPLNLGKRLKYLIQYPHGCVEQVTSSVFPQLYLDKLMALSPEKQDKIQHHIKAGIDRLRTFQHADGGFAYWPGANAADEWASSYAGHFLVEAERIGYMLPPNLLTQWQNYQRRRAQSWTAGTGQSELIQAYRLYTLALADAAELGAMNRLKEQRDLPLVARWRLAAAYRLSGQADAAEDLVKGGGLTVPAYREPSNTYGSPLRDKAMILESLCLMNRTAQAEILAKEVITALGKDRWMSTQTTAYALMAVARYAGVAEGTGEIRFAFSWNGTENNTVASALPVVQYPLPVEDALSGTIVIENAAETRLYPRLILEGVPPVGSEKASESGMTLKVTYATLSNEKLDISSLEQGTDIVASVTVTNTGDTGRYEQVALSHLVPSGWEIHNPRMNAKNSGIRSDFDYQDIRDDRIYTYFSIDQHRSKTFHVLFNAGYVGRFYLPMVSAEAMYDAAINARTPGRWITVTKQGRGN